MLSVQKFHSFFRSSTTEQKHSEKKIFPECLLSCLLAEGTKEGATCGHSVLGIGRGKCCLDVVNCKAYWDKEYPGPEECRLLYQIISVSTSLKKALGRSDTGAVVNVSSSSEGTMQQSWRRISVWFLFIALKKEKKNQKMPHYHLFLPSSSLQQTRQFVTAVAVHGSQKLSIHTEPKSVY